MTRDDVHDGPGASHPWCQDRLSEYLDDQLDERDRHAVTRHLEACPACQAAAAELEELRLRARALGPVDPPRDLWPGIRARLGEAEVVPLPVAEPAAARVPPWRRVVRLTVPQLAAAGLVLALAAGSAAWALRPVAGPAGAAFEAGAASELRRVSDDLAGAPAGVGAAESLDAILREARDRLNPNTVRILEKNLAVIQRAIDEASAALEMDPGNTFLEGYLEASLARRTQYLQDARALLDWSS